MWIAIASSGLGFDRRLLVVLGQPLLLLLSLCMLLSPFMLLLLSMLRAACCGLGAVTPGVLRVVCRSKCTLLHATLSWRRLKLRSGLRRWLSSGEEGERRGGGGCKGAGVQGEGCKGAGGPHLNLGRFED